jgi:hypothetical protein
LWVQIRAEFDNFHHFRAIDNPLRFQFLERFERVFPLFSFVGDVRASRIHAPG